MDTFFLQNSPLKQNSTKFPNAIESGCDRDLHRKRLTWRWKNQHLKMYLHQNRWFSIAMLACWRAHCPLNSVNDRFFSTRLHEWWMKNHQHQNNLLQFAMLIPLLNLCGFAKLYVYSNGFIFKSLYDKSVLYAASYLFNLRQILQIYPPEV